MAELTFPHSVTYQFDGRASVQDVALSLIAQERLMRDAISVLEGCIDGLSIENVRISVRAVAQESPLKEILAAAIVITFQDDLEKGVNALALALTGHEIPSHYQGLVTVLVMIVAIYGASAFYEKKIKKKPAPLEQEKDRLVVVAGDYYNIPADRLNEQLESKLGGGRKRSVMKSAVDFFAPAKNNAARAITGDDTPPTAEIRRDAIDAVPSALDLAQVEPETDSYPVDNVVVKFRRHDLDQSKGWAATIEDVSDERKPLHVDPSINMEGLFARKAVRGDVLVTTLRNEQGDYVPSLYYLQKVYDDQPA